MKNLFFHVDMDAFFASVEILDNPSLRGKCVLIGRNEKRSVVSTASYEARKFGVHSAMPIGQALTLCPQAVVVPPRMQRYNQLSQQIMRIFGTFSSEVIQISIDEAFLDMSGMQRLYDNARQAALLLKQKVKEETGLTISVGIAQNKFIAKMASDYDKPDGLCRVAPGNEMKFVDAVTLNKLWGIGKVTRQELARHHILSTEQLRTYSVENLRSLFGQSMGQYLHYACRGIDPGIYQGEGKNHGISTEITFIDDMSTEDTLLQYLLQMSHELMFRCLNEGQIARTIGVKIRFPDFSCREGQVTPKENIYSADQVYEIAKQLLFSKWKEGTPVRLLGLSMGNLYLGTMPIQQELFSEQNEKKRKLEEAVLTMQKKGLEVFKAATLASTDKKENGHYKRKDDTIPSKD